MLALKGVRNSSIGLYIHCYFFIILRIIIKFFLRITNYGIRTCTLVSKINYIIDLFVYYSLRSQPRYILIKGRNRTYLAYNPFSVLGGLLCYNGHSIGYATLDERRFYETRCHTKLDDIYNHLETVQDLNPDKVIRVYKAKKHVEDICLRPRSIDSGYTTDPDQEVVEYTDREGRTGLYYSYRG
jgi:hypothetical protein